MKKLLFIVISFVLGLNFTLVAKNQTINKISSEQAFILLDKAKDLSFTNVLPQNLLANQVYVELAKEGWTVGEIIRITDEYLTAHKPELKKEGTNIEYAKYWRPYYVSSSLLTSTISDYTSPEKLEKAKENVESTQNDPHAYYPRIFYTPNDRLAGIRNTGYFRQNAIMPAGGRMHWMAMHPQDSSKLMVVPDSEGIYRTNDMGKTWDCITDRIPNRYDRNQSDAYSIPVDPDNWDHIYAFMGNNTVYKTFDGGQNWSKVNKATHKGFKRGYCFRDGNGGLRFIGAKAGNNGKGAELWVSKDTCKTWVNKVPTAAQKDITVDGVKSFWFQEISFHPTNRNVLFAAGSRRILKSIDAGETWTSMTFKVYGTTTATVRAESTDQFPLATADAPMFIEINPNNGNEMWAALSTRANASSSALYKTTDGGLTWITLQEPSANIGSGGIFGNESAWNWLGGFSVNFVDQRYVYGCSMSSAESTNSGLNFTEYGWGQRHTGIYPNGSIFPVSCATHNADNHFLRGHKSGTVFRGGDAGLFVKDKNINGYKWTNITGNMGEMMFYTSTTNEFGDYAITGNTQDINIQFYRGGRWGQSQGYEGSTIWMNPYSSEEHFPYLTGGGTNIQNQDYGSWSRGWTAADVCTGNWFIRREGNNPDGSRFSVIKDFGNKSIGIDNVSKGWVQDFALSRDVPGGKLFIIRGNKLYVSTDAGTTFKLTNTSSYAPTKVAVNPDNSNEIYIAKTGAVYSTVNGGTSWKLISTAALSGVEVKSFYYHEGSGDLYFVSNVHGIFLKESNSTDWILWTKGYNTAKLADAQINYTSQEMIITDYGSGIWAADLQNPSDRYLKNGFALKQLSNTNNTRTYGVDVHYTIPLYYYFKWYVNNVLQTKETGQYFSTSTLNANDKVKLEVTLRESPDVKTTSAEFVVEAETSTEINNTRGNYLYSNQKGRLDLGYVDQFFGNFSIQMWVNPKSDGVILANRQVKTNSVKGFYISINAGVVSFNYTPENNIKIPFNETEKTSDFSILGGTIKMNEWSQLTITHDRQGFITLFVDGVQKGRAARQKKDFTLNNALYLSLFADGYEYNPIDASVDELKIWDEVLDQTTIRESMFGNIAPSNAKLIYYNDFNAATLEEQKERFSQKGMMPRTEAQITINENPIGICADYEEYKQISTSGTPFMKDGVAVMEVKSNDAAFIPNASGLIYSKSILGNNTNLLPDYYTIYDVSYGIKMFNATDLNKSVDLKFYLSAEKAAEFQNALLYSLSLTASQEVWTLLAPLTYNSDDKSLTLANVMASTIDNRRFVIVKPKPAIEIKTASIGDDREFIIYSPDTVKIDFIASLNGGLAAPASYPIKSNNTIVKTLMPLTFTDNIGNSSIDLVLEDDNSFNTKTQVTISGDDNKMIPYNFSVTNKITQKQNNVGVQFKKGGAIIGSGATFASLNGKKTATFMGWFKLDDATMLTGYKMLLFFRGTGSPATGIALNNGKIGCHWNDESWSWDVNSGLSLTTSDIGKWVHIAMVASPTGLDFYLNGTKGTKINRSLTATSTKSALMLGKNFESDSDFVGSMDQISIWNTTLTDDDIAKYMHSRVYLNEPGIVSYITFDKEETEGGYLDLKSNASVSFSGVVVKNRAANFPFNYASQQVRTRNNDNAQLIDGVAYTLPTSYLGTYKYYTSFFKGLPFNSINTKYPKQTALEDGYRTLSFGFNKTFVASENFVISIENPEIIEGDTTVFSARSIGSESTFNIRYKVAAEAGKATFTIPATVFNEDITYMFHKIPAAPNALNDNLVYRYKLAVNNKTCTILNLRGAATISVIDLHGRVYNTFVVSSPRWSMELPEGVYIVKIDELGVSCMTKIVL